MAIEHHGFNLLRHLARTGPLGEVITIGRQCVDVDAGALRAVLGADFVPDRYAEGLLTALGARTIDSLDASPYEGASVVADLCQPLVPSRQYDGVYDFGSLEHVFDIATAFRNVVALCRTGGRVAHVLPVNNLSGHGFWQFSSDLLHTVYAPHNGFEATEVYYASGLEARTWYRPPVAAPGRRVEVLSVEPIVLVCTSRKVREVAALEVQQPYYARAWGTEADGATASGAPSPTVIDRLRSWARARVPRDSAAYRVGRNVVRTAGLATAQDPSGLEGPNFERIDVARWLAAPGDGTP